jgi:formylmethanofuran dehydrogenase subunit E
MNGGLADADFEGLLRRAAELRGHLCPGLPLGIKMARKGLRLLGMEDPASRGELLVFAENNRCAVDAVQVVTGCSMGSRRLKVYEYGKSAATFYDREKGKSIRVFARPRLGSDIFKLAVAEGIPVEEGRVNASSKAGRDAMMNAFMKMTEDQIFDHEVVRLRDPGAYADTAPVPRTVCAKCGEEILDGRGRSKGGKVLCVACAGEAYYTNP